MSDQHLQASSNQTQHVQRIQDLRTHLTQNKGSIMLNVLHKGVHAI